MLKVYLAKISSYKEELLNSLNEEELAKVNRLKKEDDRIRKVLSILLLKYVLTNNSILNQALIYNDYGKPYLKDNNLFFNISHSNEYVVCALSDQEVGVDIEKVRPKNDLVISKCFSPSEQEYIVDDSDFTKVWTLKESYIKNIGTGLKTKLNSFSTIENKEITKVSNLMFTSVQIDDYHLTICHSLGKKLKLIYLN